MKTIVDKAGPALFFYVDGELLFHGCALGEGEAYGDFINYPKSHSEVWEKNYEKRYGVDFDYYPRGRIVYRKSDDTYLLYYDACIENEIGELIDKYEGERVISSLDEHYQCHLCNKGYVI